MPKNRDSESLRCTNEAYVHLKESGVIPKFGNLFDGHEIESRALQEDLKGTRSWLR